MARFVPVAIRRHLLDAGEDSEHRSATVAFLHFDGTDEILERAGHAVLAAQLDEVVRVVQDAVDTHEVTLLGSDIDHDGGKLILVSGVPRRMGDDEQRMLTALRQIADADLPIPLRIGAHTGPVFVGDGRPGLPPHVHGDGRHREPRRARHVEGDARPGARHARRARPLAAHVRDRGARAVQREGQEQAGHRVLARRAEPEATPPLAGAAAHGPGRRGGAARARAGARDGRRGVGVRRDPRRRGHGQVATDRRAAEPRDRPRAASRSAARRTRRPRPTRRSGCCSATSSTCSSTRTATTSRSCCAGPSPRSRPSCSTSCRCWPRRSTSTSRTPPRSPCSIRSSAASASTR